MSTEAARYLDDFQTRHWPEVRSRLRRSGLCAEDLGDVWNRVMVCAWKAGVGAAWFRDLDHERLWVRAIVAKALRFQRMEHFRSLIRGGTVAFTRFESDRAGSVAAFTAVWTQATDERPWKDRQLREAWEACASARRRAVELLVIQSVGETEAAAILGVNRTTAWRRCRDGLAEVKARYVSPEAAAALRFTCQGCGEDFSRRRRDQQCCSTRCRMAAMRGRRRRQPVAA